jgi:spermidine/putrescine transport system ATP-binding protein
VTPQSDVSCRGLTKRFAGQTVVDAIDLEVKQGEFFSLLGPSGCGKTTTLRMIAGFEVPTSGSIALRGKDVTRVPAHRRATNMVFQQGALFPHLTVFENIAFGLEAEGVRGAELRRRVSEKIEIVNLGGFEDRKPVQLSGGQAQRVAIARALAKEPAVLLLDEPLSALDLKLQVHMRRELKALHARLGTTFICVTHNQVEALEMSDRIAVMNEGRIEQIGGGSEIYGTPQTRFVASFIGETNFLEGEIVQAAGSRRTVAVAGGSVALESTVGAVGDSVMISVRPESISLGSYTDADAARLSATVVETRYLGSIVRYEVMTPTGTVLAIDAQPSTDFYRPGEQVTLHWLPDSATIFPAETEPARAEGDLDA